MRNRRVFLIGIITAWFPLVPGCQCFQHATQEVRLVVKNTTSGQGAPDAIVTIAPGVDLPGLIRCGERDLTAIECLDEYAERSSSPSSSISGEYVSSTDVDGEVTLVVDSFTQCGIDVGLSGRIFCPICCVNPPVDQVTGVDFYVRVETEASSEILTVEFTPGESVTGEFFEVTVVSIGEPVPVEDFD